jgi:hypothetical protein
METAKYMNGLTQIAEFRVALGRKQDCCNSAVIFGVKRTKTCNMIYSKSSFIKSVAFDQRTRYDLKRVII